MTQSYHVLVGLPEENWEIIETYSATSYAEALTMAERKYAGVANVQLGIPAIAFPTARAEGIAFNAADGLLMDDGAETLPHISN